MPSTTVNENTNPTSQSWPGQNPRISIAAAARADRLSGRRRKAAAAR